MQLLIKTELIVCWYHSLLYIAPPVTQTINENVKILAVSSDAQSCPKLCNPMNHSMPGLPVHLPHIFVIIGNEELDIDICSLFP